jgi:tetratricopeptide (TPR) repeat protein
MNKIIVKITLCFAITLICLLGVDILNLYAQRLSTLDAAWKAFDNEDYENAIKFCNKGIDDYKGGILKQEELARKSAPIPPVGQVKANEEREIFAFGALNNLAACYFIKGRAYEKQNNKNEAIKAYREAEKLTYARIHDPSWGGFWSPSEAAKERRLLLER